MDASETYLLTFRTHYTSVVGASPNDYLGFHPYKQVTCSVCKYLPHCFSGCAKQQLETQRPDKNRANIDAFRRYWEDNLEALLGIYVDALLHGSINTTRALESNTATYDMKAEGYSGFSAEAADNFQFFS